NFVEKHEMCKQSVLDPVIDLAADFFFVGRELKNWVLAIWAIFWLGALAGLGVPAAHAPNPDVYNIPTVNSSVSITAGNTFQQILAATPTNSASRRSMTIQNNQTTSDNCWVFIGGGS